MFKCNPIESWSTFARGFVIQHNFLKIHPNCFMYRQLDPFYSIIPWYVCIAVCLTIHLLEVWRHISRPEIEFCSGKKVYHLRCLLYLKLHKIRIKFHPRITFKTTKNITVIPKTDNRTIIKTTENSCKINKVVK